MPKLVKDNKKPISVQAKKVVKINPRNVSDLYDGVTRAARAFEKNATFYTTIDGEGSPK